MFNFVWLFNIKRMARSNPKALASRRFTHLLLELRDELRKFLQQKFREHNIDITYEMHQILACLWKDDGIRQQDLADKTLKDKTSLTYLVDNLSKRGLVTRLEDKNDRRSKLIFLTKKGKDLGKIADPWIAELYTIASEKISADQIALATATVEKMIANVKGFE